MKKNNVLLFILLAMVVAPSIMASPAEDAYLKARGEWITKYDRSKLSNIPEETPADVGRLSLSAERGPKSLDADGLTFHEKDERLFVTTPNILKGYLKTQPHYPTSFEKLSTNEDFYGNSALENGAHYYPVVSLPIKKGKTAKTLQVYLTHNTQDIGAYPQI